MARPATEQPLEVIAIRLPPSLIAQARRYADLYHTSLSALAREGLEIRLRSPQPTKPYDSHTAMPPAIAALVTRLATLLHESAEELHKACQSAPAPETYDGNTGEALQSYDGNTEGSPEGYDGNTEAIQEEYDGNTDTTLSAYDRNTQKVPKPYDGMTSQPEVTPEKTIPQPDIPSFAEDCQVAPAAQGHPEAPPAAPQTPQVVDEESSHTVLQSDPVQRKTHMLVQLADWHAEGMSYQEMAERLNAQHVPTLSGRGRWNRGTVSKLLAQQAQRQAQPA